MGGLTRIKDWFQRRHPDWGNAQTNPYYNLPQNGGGIMPPGVGSHGPGFAQEPPHPAVLDWLVNTPANIQAILQAHGIGGSATPLSGVTPSSLAGQRVSPIIVRR